MEIPWEFIKNIMQGIYKFTNKINGKIYIGQSVNLNNRYKQHISNYNNPSSSMYNTKFYRALRKYGLENFDYDIIEHSNYFTRDELNQKEIYYIEKYDSYQNGYNMNKGGNYTSGPKKLTDEQAHEIQNILITTRMTFEEISKKYCIQISTISYINNGQF